MVRNLTLIITLMALPGLNAAGQTAFNVYNDGMTDLVLESGVTMTIYGGYVSQTNGQDGVIDNQSVIQLTGNWLNNNTGGTNPFTEGVGVIKLIGTTEQNVGGTSTTVFNDLEVNNTTTAGGVTLTNIIYVANTLTLTDGVITTSSGSPLVMQAGSSSGAGSAVSYVDGPMRKAGTTAFTFPLGNGGVWARLAIGTPSTNTTFEAQYINSSYNNTSSMAVSPTPVLNNVSTIEYWNLTRYAGTGTATVTLYWENAARSAINNCTDLKLARWSGGAWENTFNTSGAGSCSGTGAGSISSGAAMTSFAGPLTFGSLLVDPTNPLPIDLVSFTAELRGSVVDLTWTTASELNNAYFTVEKSQDAVTFKKVVAVTGKGNSTSEMAYTATDYTPYFGFSYYRLKQTDFDGTYAYSDLVIVQNDKVMESSVFPNPVDGNSFNLRMNGVEGQTVLVTLYNSMGAQVYARPIVQKTGAMTATITIPKLKPGLYIVVGRTNQDIFRHRLVIR